MRKHVLGLYCSERTAQAVIIERNGTDSRLLDLYEWKNTLFDYAGDDTPGMDEFVDQLSRFLKPEWNGKHTAVALDTSLLFMNAIPFERSASREQVQEHLEWELSEFFPGFPRNAFVSDIHTLAQSEQRRYETILAVSVRRDLIRKLRTGLTRLDLRLDIVDSDFFSADAALRTNSPELSAKFVCLAGVKEDRIDASFLRNNDVESYSYYETHSGEDIAEKVAAISKSRDGLDTMIIFGPGLSKQLITDIRRRSSTLIETLNPLRVIGIANKIRLEKDPTAQAFRYAAAIGVALREN